MLTGELILGVKLGGFGLIDFHQWLSYAKFTVGKNVYPPMTVGSNCTLGSPLKYRTVV